MPEDVQDVFGSALLDAQYGDHSAGARPFGEGVPRGIMELVEHHDGSTFRTAYTVSFPGAVYVLHVRQNKPTSGVGMPRPDRELIGTRFEAAEKHRRIRYTCCSPNGKKEES